MDHKMNSRNFTIMSLKSNECKVIIKNPWEKFEFIQKLGSDTCVKLGAFENNLYAIKEIPMVVSKKVENVTREIQILRKIQGMPNMVQLVDIYVQGETKYIVTKYTNSNELYDFVKNHQDQSQIIPELIIKNIFRKILIAVKSLHDIGIVHQDLKMENIMYSPDTGEITLIDFGFARSFWDYRKQPLKIQHSCGSVDYVAPEVLLGVPFNPVKVDIWALGVLLYIMFTQRMPFNKSNNRDAVLKKVRIGRFPKICLYRKDISPIAVNFFERLTAKIPGNRWNIDELLEHEWMN